MRGGQQRRAWHGLVRGGARGGSGQRWQVALDSRAIRVRHMQHLRPHGAQGAPPVPSGRTGRAACAAALALRAIVGGQVPSPPDRGELAGLGVLLAAGLMVERRRRRCQLLVGFKARLAHNDAGQVVASRPRASGGALGQDLKGRTIEAQPERGVGVDVEAGRANAQPADDEGRIGGLADVGGLGAREAAGARRRLGTEMYRRLCRLVLQHQLENGGARGKGENC
mmetsp:Transcript_32438/g.104757  ORF Transcript_32438/g.104757 Transcript_32438/m.104757 type:complete len:225 (-) Transcript_32438:2350-3024(-)